MSLPATRTLWEEGREPGREMVALGVALALTLAAIDVLLTRQIGWLFDLGFVLVCVGLALAVRPRDYFTVGVLPPLLMLATFLLLGMSRAAAIAEPRDGLVQAVVSGLSHHSLALALGYLLALGVLALRRGVDVARARLDTGDELDAETGPEEPELTRTGRGPRLPA